MNISDLSYSLAMYHTIDILHRIHCAVK